MQVSLNKRELVAVEYPGTVINTKNMMKQLGGEDEVTKTFSDYSRRLELKFRPADPYSKPVYGDKFTTTTIVLEVVKRTKKRKGETSTVMSENLNVNCLGIAKNIYKFKAMCDFQILPVDYSTGKPKSLLPQLIPNDMLSSSWLDSNTPLFITPTLFSRFETPVNVYLDGVKIPRNSSQGVCDDSLRRKRASYAVYRNFESQEPIEQPREESLEVLELNPQYKELKKKIEAIFDRRPIWSKTALVELLDADVQHTRFALSSIAYTFNNGPWRKLWVKFGYDPRVDPASKIYQLMDFRVRPNIPMSDLNAKSRVFDHYIHPAKSIKWNMKRTIIKTDHLLPSTSNENDEEIDASKEFSYIFESGRLPQLRQCFYQLCDIHVDEVQQLVHQNDGQEQFCHEKDGWCDPGILDKCRELMYNEILKLTSSSSKD